MRTTKLLLTAALAVIPITAHAQVSYSGATPIVVISGYDPSGQAGTLAAPVAGLENATLSASSGLLTVTFLGSELLHADTFSFPTGSGSLSNHGVLGSSISGIVPAGFLSFLFSDIAEGVSIGNGGPADRASYALLGSFAGPVFSPATLGGAYDLILGFNDGPREGADFDDMVVGLRLRAAPASVPEPASWSLMLVGLGLLGFALRRRGALLHTA